MNNNLEKFNYIYFLFYSGLIFSDISKIIPFHFIMKFSLLKIRQGKKRKIFISKIISNCLNIFDENRKKIFFFYEDYIGDKNLHRIQYIKYNFSYAINAIT